MTWITGTNVWDSGALRFVRADVQIAGGQIAGMNRRCEKPRAKGAPADGDDAGATPSAGKSPAGYLVPGFVDAHFHLLALAMKRLRCDLSGCRDVEEVYEALRVFADARPADAVVGVEWDESGWVGARLPTRKELDAVCPDRPLLARRICCHVGVVNTALLERLTSPRSCVDRETGTVVEEAVAEATRITYPDPRDIEASVEPAIAELHALGVTGIHDIVEPSQFDAWLGGLARARRPLRVDALLHVGLDEFDPYANRIRALDRPWIRAGGIKVFSDGSLGGHTAALNARYADRDTTGDLLVDPVNLRATAAECIRRGLVCAVHAIGDQAVDTVARAMTRARSEVDGAAAFRIEHAEILGPEQLGAVERAGAALVMQPNFVRNWGGVGGLYETRLGTDRWLCHNPFRGVAEHGIALAFSSDGMPPGPLYGLAGATEHPVAGQSLSFALALHAYTRGAWTLPGHEFAAGEIEPGMAADLVLLSNDPRHRPEPSIRAVWVAGERVFDAAAPDGQS